MSDPLIDGQRRGRFADLPRRIYLTYRYRGFRSVLYQTIVFPLRLTPLDRVLSMAPGRPAREREARRWYKRHGRPVAIVIPSYRDAPLVATLVAGIRRTTRRELVRIIVADDASGPEHLTALGAIDGIEIVAGDRNGGFAVNANRGLRAAGDTTDVVLLNSDVVPLRGWLDALQWAADRDPTAGVVAAKLLYPDNRIQYAGTIRNPRATEWFDHRHRFRAANWGPADVPGPTLAATGACMYVTRAALERVGTLDESLPMAYEDVDYGLRAWQTGMRVIYEPAARLHHLESVTRGTELGERELASQRRFWEKWSTTLDERRAVGEDGRLRVVYVTEDTIVAGGLRVVFEHLNGLLDRGHDVSLWTLGPSPDWFELRCPVRTFTDYDALERALTPLEAIKVATWWPTALPVWRASVLTGIPLYLVQDIETSYYRDSPERRFEVLDSYRPEFRYLTTSAYNRELLSELGMEATIIAPGMDLDTFAPRPDVTRRLDMVLALGRSNPLKNLPLTRQAWRRLPAPRPELCLFGSEPELVSESGVRYVTAPSDPEVNALLNEATVFVQTSTHEGFCLPVLEAMATGAAVVCTDAHGNRDFCIDGENCLMPAPDPGSVSAALSRVLGDRRLRERLGATGMQTAGRYAWPRQIDELEAFLRGLSPVTGPQRPAERSG